MHSPAIDRASGVRTAAAAQSPATHRRIESIDVVRGIVMIIMALDHTRDFFGIPGQNPTNLGTTTPALFLTRWVTHFCAPTFFLLTGTSAFLVLRRSTPSALSGYLFKRGVWLIFLELVIVRSFAYQFNVDFKVTLLLVLWALGWSMITLAALVRLPAQVVTILGLLMVVLHNVLDFFPIANPILALLHAPGFVINTPEFTVFSSYPLIPWVGVTAAGFGLGQLFVWDSERRRAQLLRLGIAMSVTFVLLRFVNVYGDPSRWSMQASTLFTLGSFLNTTKYPPSLLFLLMTLGPAMLVLRAVDRATPRWLEPARIIGTVPLFYFVLHFMLIHLLAVIVCFAQQGSAHWMFESPDLGNYPFTPPPGWGFSLPIVYTAWVSVVLMSYPLCRWFSALKQRRRDPWLRYL